MKNFNFRSILPIVVGIAIFIALTLFYFNPLLKGKVLLQSDMVQNSGMAKEVKDHREKYNEEALWTNSMFGGMPAYQISITYPSNLVRPLRDALFLKLPTPANMVFIYMFGFFILLLTLKVDKWLSIIGAIGYGFSAFFFLIIDAGHNTQAFAIGFMAPVFAGVVLVCRGRHLLGGAVLALFAALELLCNHPQITYYLLLLCLVYIIYEFVERIKQKQFKEILKMMGVFVLAGVLALGSSINNLWNTYEYAKYTIRGPSELTSEKHNKTSGLDKDYATQWSMGKSETLTLLIPGFKGRTDGLRISENKNAMKAVDPNMREAVGNLPQYWGEQPTTSSPYSGAIIVFLFVFALFVVKGRIKWTLLTITILSITLSWGKNMMWLTDLFLDYFPMYNKFRAVSMTLVLAEVAIPILAVLALDKLIRTPDFFKQKIKLAFSQKEITVQNAFIISFVLTGGLSLLFYLLPDTLSSFTWIRDAEVYKSYSENAGEDVARQLMDNIEKARIVIFKGEAIRSFLFITAAAILIWLFANSKINKTILIPVLGLLFLADLIPVDKSFLNDDNFTSKQQVKNPFPETFADKAILEDKDLSYRVLDLSDPNGFNNSARASFYHKSIGGYHAVKLRRYQELIDYQIGGEIQDIYKAFKSSPTEATFDSVFAKQSVLNMLNMRYIIYNTEAPPLMNKHALGNAWFVNTVKMVNNADEEIKQVGEIDPSTVIVVDKRYENELSGFTPKADPSASIKLTDYKANDLKYESNSSVEQLAVFSEIYYKDGWNAYIDGEQRSYFSGDWILRAMRIPAGKHTIEFKFQPQRYLMGEKIALISSLLLFVAIGAALFFTWKNRKKCEVK
ncbi:MAG TPA: hypothetical protein VLB84_00685 [Bacteroidia bacterium]|nr:hypothetical protein [Bacteroidia bacterium]